MKIRNYLMKGNPTVFIIGISLIGFIFIILIKTSLIGIVSNESNNPGSMHPTIIQGDTFFVCKVPDQWINIGDIVVFRDPQDSFDIFHRVVGKEDIFGESYFITKGDHKEIVDIHKNGDIYLKFSDIKGKVIQRITPYGQNVGSNLRNLMILGFLSVMLILWLQQSKIVIGSLSQIKNHILKNNKKTIAKYLILLTILMKLIILMTITTNMSGSSEIYPIEFKVTSDKTYKFNSSSLIQTRVINMAMDISHKSDGFLHLTKIDITAFVEDDLVGFTTWRNINDNFWGILRLNIGIDIFDGYGDGNTLKFQIQLYINLDLIPWDEIMFIEMYQRIVPNSEVVL